MTDEPTRETKIQLWRDSSPKAATLDQRLKDYGYAVETVYTAAEEPAALVAGRAMHGYSEIELDLLSRGKS